MQIDVEKQGDVAVLRPRCHALLADLADLRRELSQHADDGAHVLVDLAEVRYLSGRAIELVGRWTNRVRAQGRDLKLVNASDHVRRLLDVAGGSPIVQICSDEETALASFGSGVGAVERMLLNGS